ncbi:MAG: ATP-binding cassette domain-containing protein [bacterium]
MVTKTHISVKDLSIWYGGQQALNNITIDIPDKKITAIIGPSGCGKTTLLKSFNRLIELREGIKVEGRVLVDGEDIYDPAVEIINLRKKMGYLSQRPQVLPMSIYENIVYGPKIHGLKDKKKLEQLAERYLKEAHLWDEVKNRLHASASGLSIGQQQRLCLARGLAVEPEVILGDEPTSALDPISSNRIEEQLMELKNRYTIVLVTHSLAQARRVADYVIFLYLGNLIEHGPAGSVFRNPRYFKTQNYVNGKFIEEPKVDKVLDLKGTVSPGNFVKIKLAIEEIAAGNILKIIIDNNPESSGIPNLIEFDGHKILEIKRLDKMDWEIVMQKQERDYIV